MITLYTYPLSGNGRKVHWCLEEVGARYELMRIDLIKGEQKSSHYLTLNPNGKVPTLVDGDFVLWESNAILCYLAEKYPAVALMPTPLHDRARVFQWLLFEQTTFRPPISLLYRQTRFTPIERQDKQLIEQTWSEVRTNMEILTNTLVDRQYIGVTFSVADMAVLPYVYLVRELGFDLSPWPAIAAYYKRLSTLPNWQKVLAWK